MNLKSINNKNLSFIMTLFVLFTFCQGSAFSTDTASIKETKKVFLTYPFSGPDPVPNIGRIYPYFKFLHYSQTGADKQWKIIQMENKYIKLFITPQIGGKIWGAFEKSKNLPFIYYNKVVKFRNIAMRGPWTSGGIEFNFGVIGHTPTCSTPVDYLIKNNTDGSVSCIIGAIDLPSRTQWRVKVRLPEDKAYFTTGGSWYNPTAIRHSYYHWMNGAADSGNDLKLYFPGNSFINHGGKPFAWPIDHQGRDISVYSNNNFGSSKSYHVLGQLSEFFGGYWRDIDFGFGNWSLYDDKPGKKLWIWSLAPQGAIWEDLLTDEGNQQYIEMQSGRLLNQAAQNSSLTPFKHAFFSPCTYDEWEEYWFPVKDIGGMVKANSYGILNMQVNKNNILSLGFCSLQYLKNRLTITIAGKLVYKNDLSLKPASVFREKIKLPDIKGEIEISIGDKLKYCTGENKKGLLNRPIRINPLYNWNSAQGLCVSGEELAKQRFYDEALQKFLQSLKIEPAFVRSLNNIAQLYIRRGEYHKALAYLKKALSIDTYHQTANYFYGVVNNRMQNFTDAKDGFGWAARSMEYRSAAYTQIAGIYLKERNLNRAENYASRALNFNKYNTADYQILAIIYRLQNQELKAQKVLHKLYDIDPLSHFSRFEKYLWHSTRQNFQRFNSLISNELPHETYLELALTYLKYGAERETIKVLKNSPPYPIVDYWLAYLYKNRSPKVSRSYLQKALNASPRLVFPFRWETIKVLKWAKKALNHWKSGYYLGLILWNKGRTDEAYRLFKNYERKPDFWPFYVARSNLLKELKPKYVAEPDKLRLADLKQALRSGKENWQTRHALSLFYKNNYFYQEGLKNSKEAYQKFPQNYIIAMDYVNFLLFNRKYKKCLSILDRTTILPYEGAWEGRNLYKQANLLLAAEFYADKSYSRAIQYIDKARLWPRHLGVGKPYSTDERLQDYMEARCLHKIGKTEEGNKLWSKIIKFTRKKETKQNSLDFIGLLALQKFGYNKEMNQLLHRIKNSTSLEKQVAKWITFQMMKDKVKAGQLLRDLVPGDRDFNLLVKITGIINK